MLNVRRLCVVVDSLISAVKVCDCVISAWCWQVCDRVVELRFRQNILCQPLLRFSQTCEFWSSKANWRLRFMLPSIILTDLLGKKKLYFNGFKRSWIVISDWWISIRFVSFCVSRFVDCDRNHDWRQRKTQLWRRLLNFRLRTFVKSAVILFFRCLA